MNKLNKFGLCLVLGIMASFTGCNEKTAIPPDQSELIAGRILKFTCGGTAVQIIEKDTELGEDWRWPWDEDEREVYKNCILLMHETKPGLNEGDSIRFSYQSEFIDFGKKFCDLGGLPRTFLFATKLDVL